MRLSFVRRIAAALTAVSLTGLPFAASAAEQPQAGVTNVVLVHGAFADGSSWAKIIPLLEQDGLHVIAVQNPLTSLDADVAATKQAIARADGPVLLVGHSWGGAVISQAGVDPKVAGLVYVAAGAPAVGESLMDNLKAYPPAPGLNGVKPDANGFLVLSKTQLAQNFAQDLPAAETEVMAATQGPWAAQCASQKVTAAAWTTKPSWYVVASKDRMINPEAERAFAKRIKANTLTLATSHVPMLSKPDAVAALIETAAKSLHPVSAAK